MRVWRDLLDYRGRLKAEALATGKDAPRRSMDAARRTLIAFDTEVASIASGLRGWRTLKGVVRTSRMAAPSRVRAPADLAADFVATEKLAKHAWYTSLVGFEVEPLVERLLVPCLRQPHEETLHDGRVSLRLPRRRRPRRHHRLPLHDTRHTTATRLRRVNLGLDIVQKALGIATRSSVTRPANSVGDLR